MSNNCRYFIGSWIVILAFAAGGYFYAAHCDFLNGLQVGNTYWVRSRYGNVWTKKLIHKCGESLIFGDAHHADEYPTWNVIGPVEEAK